MRWPLEPLAALIGGRPGAMALGFDSGEWSRAQRSGLGDIAADRWATRCGLHPFTVWPEMADAAIDAVSMPCAHCTDRFHPERVNARYCSLVCKRRAAAARYYARHGDRKRAAQRAYDRHAAAARQRRAELAT